MNNDLISIIIIFYNAEKFINESIQSVIEQSYTNWELILVDDGSDDESTQIAKKYQSSMPEKIKYVEHEGHANKGMSASRNRGIEFSQGNFVSFLDADDKYMTKKLEEQLKIFKQHPQITSVIGATKYWFSWDSSNMEKDIIRTLKIPSRIYLPGELFRLLLMQRASSPAICSIMVRKNFLELIEGFEEEFSGMYEDQVYYSKLAQEGINFVDHNYYELYRQHSESCYSSAKIEKSVFHHKQFYLEWLKKYITDQKITDKKIHKILKRDIWLSRNPRLNYIYNRLLKQRRKFFPVRTI